LETIIEILKYVFIGMVQGITETLPISSSGHLLILQELLNFKQDQNLTFEILLHFGSLIAICIFYRQTIKELLVHFFSYLFKRNTDAKADFRLCWLIVLATLPAAITGLLLEDFITMHLTSLLTIGISLLFTSMILYIISQSKKGYKDFTDVTIMDAIMVGVMQAFAIIPGISRSGSTVSMSLARKLSIDTALRFSFLLFIPVALGATLVDLIDFVKEPDLSMLSIPYLLAFLASIVFTFISLNILIDVLKKGKLHYFSIYCFVVGLISVTLFFI
jgi:undecaprenyl-diphosphatase